MLILLFIQRNLFNKNNKPENLPQFLNRGGKNTVALRALVTKTYEKIKHKQMKKTSSLMMSQVKKNKCYKCLFFFCYCLVFLNTHSSQAL